MKKIALNIFLLILCPVLLFGQESPIDELFEKYAEKDGFTTVYISSFMFQLMQKFADKDEDSEEVKKLMSKLEGIKILTADDDNSRNLNFYQEVIDKVPMNEYKELMVVKEKGQELKMLLKEPKDGEKGEFLMIGGGDDNLLISIIGNIDLESLSKLSNSMDIKGMDKLKNIEPKDSTSGK